MRDLVVDDSFVMRKVIKKQLDQLGIDSVVEAKNGREAIKEIIELEKKQLKIDLILTDWKMPKMTGIEFVKAVRQTNAFRKVPIIMIATNNTKAEVRQALATGIDNYITKPFTPSLFRTKIVDTLKEFRTSFK